MVETCSLQTKSSESDSSAAFSIASENPFNKYLAKKAPFQTFATTLVIFRPDPPMFYAQPVRHKTWQPWIV